VHDAVHPTGEPGENGKGWGTTLGTAKKSLTPFLAGAHGVPRQAARSGKNTGQEAFGGPRPACWEGPPGVGSVGRSPPAPGGFGRRDRRLRAAGAGSGSGSADLAPMPSGSGVGARIQPVPGSEALGSRGREAAAGTRHRSLRAAASGAGTPELGSEALGPRGRAPAAGTRQRGPRATRQGIRQPPVHRRRGLRATAVGDRRSEVQEDRLRVAHRQLATVGPEERARETSSVTRGHHRFCPQAPPPQA
jgi:hypothetical protein